MFSGLDCSCRKPVSYRIKKDDTLEECVNYIGYLGKHGKLIDKYLDDNADLGWSGGYAGYSFTNSESTEFKKIKDFYDKSVDDYARQKFLRTRPHIVKTNGYR